MRRRITNSTIRHALRHIQRSQWWRRDEEVGVGTTTIACVAACVIASRAISTTLAESWLRLLFASHSYCTTYSTWFI
ncbi:hypothetical protein BDW02DRAFT_573202 [Decorospora gaudefroyi]|uniref:Uncharacterized protein n=1 Tax=Decorospora gaudefroyi TaxID=184978 RepID=A0A6A5KAA1_9PLEO|nr:hypothetical protein BDW02DRAFT_573202 [Decorospora gaudefroyi]